MRRMCGLSSQIRNRSLLKSMRYMVRPGQAKQYTGVNHIAALVKEWVRSRPVDLAWIADGATFFGQEPGSWSPGGHQAGVRIRTARAGCVPQACDRGRKYSARTWVW